jgi:anti-sigma B factor antagonist
MSGTRPEHEHFNVEIGTDGALVVLGDIDIATGPALEEAIAQHDTRSGSIVIDLAGVDFIDSSGLRTLLGASTRARAADRHVTLRSVGPEVSRLLDLTRTAGQFEIESTRG